MCKRVVLYSAVAFVLVSLALIFAGPVVKGLSDQKSPYLNAIADISAPPASALPNCNYLVCTPDVGHPIPWYCDSGEGQPTLCTVTGPGSCTTTTECKP